MRKWQWDLGNAVFSATVETDAHGTKSLNPLPLFGNEECLRLSAVGLAASLCYRGRAVRYFVELGFVGRSGLAEELARFTYGHVLKKGEYNDETLPAGALIAPVVPIVGSGKMIVDEIEVIRRSGFAVQDVVCVIDCDRGAFDALAGIGVRLHSLFTPDELLNWEKESIREGWEERLNAEF